MVSASRSFVEHVGHVLFPRGPKDLTDPARCPACFVALPKSLVCGSCSLDMNHPDADLLREESLNVAALLDARLELIGKIRFETAAEHNRVRDAHRDADQAALEAAVAHRESRASVAPAPLDHITAPVSPDLPAPPAKPELAQPTAARPHAGIQVILLIVGVSLLSVGAIFFLIYAFLTFGLIWRSAIIASITIASIIAATKMKQRGLSATAEALSALAIVFVILDIFALRANDLLVIGDPEGRLYWGGALLVASISFMLWHRASKLVLVNVIGFVLFPPAAALLAMGVAQDQTFVTASLVAVCAFAAASLIHAVAAHDKYSGVVERVITVSYAVIALAAGLVIGVLNHAAGVSDGTAVWMIVLAVIAAVHGAVLRGPALVTAVRYAFATVSGLFLGVAVWMVITPQTVLLDDPVSQPSRIVVLVAALTVTALLVEAMGIPLAVKNRPAMRWTAVGVWAIAASATLIPLFQASAVATQFLGLDEARRTTPANAPFEILERGWPQLALLAIPVAMGVVWWLTGQLRARIHLVLGSTGIALALAAPLTGTLITAIVVWLMLAVAAVIVIALDRKRRGTHRVHLTIALGGALPLVLAYGSGWSSHATWVLSSLTAAVLLIAARSLVSHTTAKASLIGAAALVLIIAAAGAGEQLQFTITDNRPNALESWLTAGIASVVILGLALWTRIPTVHPAERRTLWWIGLSGVALSAVTLWTASVDGAPSASAPLALNLPVVSLVIAVSTLALLAITLGGTAMRERTESRYVAAALLAPATVWALDSASRSLGLADIAIELAPATASVLVGALSMAMRVRGMHPKVRRVSEASALLVAAITAVNASFEPRDSHWLIVVLVAITLLLASIARDGIFGSQSPRRHIVWAAVAFGTWALWLRLDQTRVDALEAYVLPLAAVLLAITILTARAELRQTRLTSAPAIALVALLIAVLPLALNAATGNGLRTLVIAGLCGAVLLTACFVEPHERLVDFWGVAIIGSGVGLIASTASRALVLANESRSWLPELDSWLLGAVAVIALGSFGLAATRFTTDPANSRWAITSEVLLGTAIVLLYAVETVVLLDSGSIDRALDGIRIVGLVAIGSAALLLTARGSVRPLTRRLSYLAFALASVVGAIAYFGNLISPLEWVTVILGSALLANGAIHMTRRSDLRSFPALSAGLIVILLPSLIATFVDTNSVDTAWRILALGIASVAAIVAGSWLKLQAPLIIGTTVALIHAAHTFAPALVTLYQLTDWWVWAVIGGAVVLFLGITLERRIRDLKVVNSRFSALR